MNQETNSSTSKKIRTKRPDKALYVPKHLRLNNSNQENYHLSPNQSKKVKNESTEIDSHHIDNNNSSSQIIKDALQDTCLNSNEGNSIPVLQNSRPDTSKIKDTSQSSLSEQFPNNSVSPISEYQSPATSDDNEGEESWFSKFTEDGEAVDPQIMDEISEKMGKVAVKKAVIDYLEFSPNHEIDMSDEEFGHLLEIYDFPKEFATQDLLMAFKDHQSKGFDIKWVDDTHAIAIFAGAVAASNVLRTFINPSFKIRPISHASRQTKLKAKRCTEFLVPQKPRPEMSVHVARNLLVAALGIKPKISKEQRAQEHLKISKAREKKKADLKCKQDAWEGTFNN